MLAIPTYYFAIGIGLFAILGFWGGRMVSSMIYHEKSQQILIRRMSFCNKLPAQLIQAAEEVELNIVKLRYVDSDQVLAFTYGLLRPKIVVSKGLIELLDIYELKAVLLHEEYHSRSRDPLKLLIIKVLLSFFTRVPSVSKLIRNFAVSIEIAADKYAMLRLADRSWYLPSALLKMINHKQRKPVHAVGFAEDIEARITHCLNGEWQPEAIFLRKDHFLFSLYFSVLLIGSYYALNEFFYWLSCH